MRNGGPKDVSSVVGIALVRATVVVAIVGVVAIGAASGATAQDGYALAQDQPEPDNSVTRLDVAPNGSTTWRITFRTRLATDQDVAEYERFQASFANDTARYLDPFEERMRGVVAGANDASDREMRAREFSASTSIQEVPRRWGIVTFRFTWDGFAAVDGDRVVVGDVFDGGFYIGDGDVLEIAAPPGFVVTDTEPTPDEVTDSVVEWKGREDFADREPHVVMAPADAATEIPAGDDTDGSAEGVDAIVDGDLLVLVTAGLLVAGVLAFLVGRERLPRWSSEDDQGLPSEGSTSSKGSPPSERSETTVAGAGATGGSDAESDELDSELLTDEDRVERLLRERGGRVKQSVIVDELDWSKSKTSRVLSRMAEEGTVEKLRIGRENVIDLSDEDG